MTGKKKEKRKFIHHKRKDKEFIIFTYGGIIRKSTIKRVLYTMDGIKIIYTDIGIDFFPLPDNEKVKFSELDRIERQFK